MATSTTAVSAPVPASGETASRHAEGEIIGAYALKRVLGRGGMGEVWEGTDGQGAPVALKLMHAEDAGDAERRSRFMREARVLANVQHRNVVGIRDVFEATDGLVLVMERLRGETLRSRIEREPLSVKETTVLVEQLLDALSAIHAKGIVHRDLKPDNLFLVDAGGSLELRVLDFGIAAAERIGARTLTDLTQSGTILGTPAYMSPEQLYGEEVDGRSDLWSVGIVIHTCITGTCPTEDDALGGVIKRVTKDPVPSIRDLLSPALADLVEAVLHKERVDRPASAAACLAILHGARTAPAEGQPTRVAGAKPTLASAVATKPSRVGPVAIALLVMLGLFCAGFLALGWFGATQGKRTREQTWDLGPTIAKSAPTEPSAAVAPIATPPLPSATSAASSTASASATPARTTALPAGRKPAPKVTPASPPSAPRAPSTAPKVEDIVLGQ